MTTKPLLSPALTRCLLAVLAMMMLVMVAATAARLGGTHAAGKFPVEFEVFYLAGQLVWQGQISQAYFVDAFIKLQTAAGHTSYMPWTYPPPFNLICAPLALLPLPIAYLVFTATTLAAYLVVLRRLAADSFVVVLAASIPAIAIGIKCGHNGFLTATLIGWACLWLLRQRPGAGVPLGLMVIKPHLAIPLGLVVLMRSDWRTIAVAAATTTLAAAISTLAFGPDIWTAFANGAAEAKVFLLDGQYQHYRMISLYAALYTAGVSPPVALAAQAVAALAVLAALAMAARRGLDKRQLLGWAALACPVVGPYAYDYDTCICGIGLALLMPRLALLMTPPRQLALVGLVMLGGSTGLIQNMRFEDLLAADPTAASTLASYGVLAWLGVAALIAHTLWHGRTEAAPVDLTPAQGVPG